MKSSKTHHIIKKCRSLLLFKKGLYGLLFVCCLVSSSIKAQGYYNDENFGNRSILLSGNVTGSVDDLGLTYYNPARLAIIEEPNFTISARAYQMGSIKIENVFGRNNKLNQSKFGGLPSLAAATFKVGKSEKHKFAYAVLSRKQSNISLGFAREIDAAIVEEFDNVDRFIAELNLSEDESDEWFGFSWATKLKENLSVGVSTFVSVYDFSGSYKLDYSRLDTTTDVAAYNNEIRYGQKSYGIFWKVGLAWQVSKFDLGLNIDLPYLEVLGDGNLGYKEILSGIGDGNDVFKFDGWDDLESKRRAPIGVAFGAGFPLGKNKIHLKVDWHGGLKEYNRLVIPVIDDSGEVLSFSFKEELRPVINFGLGAEFYLGEKVGLYMSAGTDFSPVVSDANIFDLITKENQDTNFDADYYHFGSGVQLKLSWAQLVLGATYTTASATFDRVIQFPDPDIEIPNNDDPARVTLNRWRFILGLEIPIFGKKIEIK